MDTRHIRIIDFNYDLPEERIAKFPMARRDQSKLLVYRHGEITDDKFFNLPNYLPAGALMVFNNTKVIQARLHFRKQATTDVKGRPLSQPESGGDGSARQGALIEVFLLEPAIPCDYEQMFQTRGRCSWYCLVGNLKKWKEGTLIRTLDTEQGVLTISATRGPQHGTSHRVDFEWELLSSQSQPSFAEVIDAVGELPIPPYLNREAEESDKRTYQTVYSKIKGSVAAPTAGLHFTPEVLADIDAHGIDREELTLHVGAGTFKPVKSEEIEGHEMHTEFISVRRQTIDKLLKHSGEAIAVGTTSVRTLESLYWMGLKVLANPGLSEEQLHVGQWEPYDRQNMADRPSPVAALQALAQWMDTHGIDVLHSSTQIIIAPGYDYRIVKMLVTNFHQPQSTLLLLVSAFVNGDWQNIYDYALGHGFRFLSYGDSSLLIP